MEPATLTDNNLILNADLRDCILLKNDYWFILYLPISKRDTFIPSTLNLFYNGIYFLSCIKFVGNVILSFLCNKATAFTNDCITLAIRLNIVSYVIH